MNFPKPFKLKANIEGHIMEQNKPPLRNANIATSPVVTNPIIIAVTPKIPNIFRVGAGRSLPIKKPAI